GSSPRVAFPHKANIPNWSVQTVRTSVPPSCNFAVAIISFCPTDATVRMPRLPQLPHSVQYFLMLKASLRGPKRCDSRLRTILQPSFHLFFAESPLASHFNCWNLAAFCPEADCSRRYAQPPGDGCGR